MPTKPLSRVPISLHNSVMANLRKYLLLASNHFNTQFNEPTIVYAKKGTIAGSAILNKWIIQINISMLIDHGDLFINEVVPHELAHLIAYKQFGRIRPHGKEWQYVMAEIFDCSPRRTHSFQLPTTVIQNRHHYQCDCQQHQLTTIRHNKIQQKQVQYFCKQCGTILRKI